MRNPLFLLLICSGLSAQVVSPSAYTTVEGPSNNTYPFYFASHRYQQIHHDMLGSPLIVTSLAFRRDGSSTAYSGAVARTFDCEWKMSFANYAAYTTTFANNYSAAPITVFTRKNLSFPDHTQPNGVPAPFDAKVTLDVPFPYPGVFDLLWEAFMYSNSAANQGYPCDAFGSSPLSDFASSVVTITGVGCVATGRTSPMAITAVARSLISSSNSTVAWWTSNATASSPGATLLSAAGASLPVPGMCASVFIDPTLYFASFNGVSDPAGTLNVAPLSVPYNPALVGFAIHAQSATIDGGLGQNVPVAVSNGVQVTIPALPSGPAYPIVRVYGGITSPTGGTETTYNYGLIVQFN